LEKYYSFNDDTLLELALTHSSFSNENVSRQNNQRLEFLGDAVLELIVTEYLYDCSPEMSEGDMTRLRATIVCEPSLCAIARKIGLGERLMLGNGEEASGGRERGSILSDALEALIGATFIDRGLSKARSLFVPLIEASLKAEPVEEDYKSRLQELVQEKYKNTVSYRIAAQEGPAHDKKFTAEALHGDKVVGVGEGKSKKEAEQQAALRAMKTFGFAGAKS